MSIRVGHSALFRSIDGLRALLGKSHEPLELDFPAREDELQNLLSRIDDITAILRNYSGTILSIHAHPVEMDSDEFIGQALELARVAEAAGAESITFHPSKSMKKEERDRRRPGAVENIRAAQVRTPITLAVETLGHSKCLFNPDEIMEHNLPMVLDTTHVGWKASYRILESYNSRIVTIHLSERTEHTQHQPITEQSLVFIDRLLQTGWQGNLILEYWPWRWGLYSKDVERIEKHIQNRQEEYSA